MVEPPHAAWLTANLDALAAALGVAVPLPDASDGRWQATLASDGPSLHLRTAAGTLVAAHSRRQPAAEARRLVDDALGGSGCPACAIVIGAGLGYVVGDLLGRDPAMRVLVLEPDASGTAALLGAQDWRAVIGAGRLLVLTGPDYRGAEAAWRLVTGDAPPVVVVHPVLAREYPDDARRAAAVAGRVVADARANAGAEAALGARYLLHTIANLGVVGHEGDAGALDGAFDGVPAVVVAAGPSLDRVIGDLRRFQARALIIAVDTALRPLLVQGIRPHLAVAVDPSDRNGRHLIGLPGAGGTWLVGEPAVHPPVFETFAGRTFTFRVGDNHPWPWLAGVGVTRGVLAAWGSVLVSALDVARRVGADPIAIVGADLAYTGGQPYARGTSFEDDWAREVRGGARLGDVWGRVAARPGAHEQPDVHGRPVATLPHLVAFRDRLLTQIAASRRRIVNATGGGILHGSGVTLGTLADLLGASPAAGDLRVVLTDRHGAAAAAQARERAALLAALAAPAAVPTLARLVPGVEENDVAAAVDAARPALAAPRTQAPQPETVATATLERPVWLPEQAAALATLLDGSRAPQPEAGAGDGTTLADVVTAARAVLAAPVLAAGPLEQDALTAGAVLGPLPLLAPIAAEARSVVDRFGSALTHWILTRRPATSGHGFWSDPPQAIDGPDEIGQIDRSADEILRAAAVTALARTAGAPDDDALARLADGIVRAWPQVAAERPRAVRLELMLEAGAGAPLPWIANAPAAPLARALAGHLVATGPAVQTGAGGLRPLVRLAIDTGDAWEDAGASIGASMAIHAAPAPDSPCLHAAALDDGRAVVTRQDQQGGYIVDAAGAVTPAPSWPSPVFAQAPLDAAGRWYAWTVRPSRLFVRDADGATVQEIELPFTPTGALPVGDGLRFTAIDGVWLWSAARGARHEVETEPLVTAVPDGHGGLDLTPLPPVVDGIRRRGRRLLRWSPADGLRAEAPPPIGPCWSRSVHAGWTADAFPDAALVRLSDPSGVRGWMICDHPRTVAWAGPALVVVSMAGRVLVVPGVRDALRRAAAGS